MMNPLECYSSYFHYPLHCQPVLVLNPPDLLNAFNILTMRQFGMTGPAILAWFQMKASLLARTACILNYDLPG